MDDVITASFGGYKKDGKWVSVSTVRLWPSILATARWLLSAPKPQQSMIHSGARLIALNSLAIAVEGFIGDMIFAKLDSGTEVQPDDVVRLESATWEPKRKLFNKHFEKPLESYPCWDSIEILLYLRNNLLHGLSYTEKTVADHDTGLERSNISSDNEKYQKVREFFIAKRLLDDTHQMSNRETLWKIEIVAFFLGNILTFLVSVMRENTDNKFLVIQHELDIALKIS